MVIIELSETSVGLIFTLVNACVEFTFLTAMLTMLALHECKLLKQGKIINIRRHCHWVRSTTLLAIILFIALEITFSRAVKNETRPVKEHEPCVRTQINIPSKIPLQKFSKEEILITYNCLNSTTDTFRVHLGNYSTKTGKVECAAKDVFNYRIEHEDSSRKFSVNDGSFVCRGEPIESKGRGCVTARAEGNVVYLSDTFDEVQLNETKPTPKVEFYPTKLSFDPRPHLHDFAENYVTLLLFHLNDELRIRTSTFLRSTNATCTFTKGKMDVTMIPSIFLAGIVVLWSFSLILFGLMLFRKREVFYDVQNTWDCATKTSYRFDSSETDEFYIKCIEANGEKRVYVTNSGEADRFDFEEDCIESSDSQLTSFK